jgi:phosphate transport system permease protein
VTKTFYNTYSRLVSHAAALLCSAFAFGIVAVLCMVVFYLFGKGASALSWQFFTELPGTDPQNPKGMRHALEGTLIMVSLAAAVGVPLGILVGVYLSEYSSDRFLPSIVRFVADVLAGVPSIVVGILGYELLVVPMGTNSGYAGAAALAFIMIPIVARTTEEMLKLVPKSYREGSLALGATKSQTILKVVLPAATGSIVTGVLLAIARAAGETAPLLFTALSSQYLTRDPSQPFPSLTVQIYNYATGPFQGQKTLAWAGILVLISLFFVLSLAVRWLTRRAVIKMV